MKKVFNSYQSPEMQICMFEDFEQLLCTSAETFDGYTDVNGEDFEQ